MKIVYIDDVTAFCYTTEGKESKIALNNFHLFVEMLISTNFGLGNAHAILEQNEFRKQMPLQGNVH